MDKAIKETKWELLKMTVVLSNIERVLEGDSKMRIS